MLKLTSGEYLGQPLRSRSAGRLALTVTAYPPRRAREFLEAHSDRPV